MYTYFLTLTVSKITKSRKYQETTNISTLSSCHLPSHHIQESMANLSTKCLEGISYFHCMEQGIPPHQIIAVEWTPQSVYRVFRAPHFLVETFIAVDDSYLISNQDRQFLYHYIPVAQPDRHEAMEYVYSANAVPPIPPDSKQESSYDLQSVAERALKLLDNAHSLDMFRQTVTSKKVLPKYGDITPLQTNEEELIPKMSNHVKHYQISAKFGEFTYFEDRRVKIRFADRTLLELAGHWKSCTIITKRGEEIKDIDCENPVRQFTEYIQRALQFAKWCSLSKAEQLQYQRSQIQIQNDIQRQIDYSQRLIESNQITKEMDFDRFIGEDVAMEDSVEIKDPENINQDGLIKSIQSQLNDIDKLLGSD